MYTMPKVNLKGISPPKKAKLKLRNKRRLDRITGTDSIYLPYTHIVYIFEDDFEDEDEGPFSQEQKIAHEYLGHAGLAEKLSKKHPDYKKQLEYVDKLNDISKKLSMIKNIGFRTPSNLLKKLYLNIKKSLMFLRSAYHALRLNRKCGALDEAYSYRVMRKFNTSKKDVENLEFMLYGFFGRGKLWKAYEGIGILEGGFGHDITMAMIGGEDPYKPFESNECFLIFVQHEFIGECLNDDCNIGDY